MTAKQREMRQGSRSFLRHPPPRKPNTNGKGRITDLLLRKIAHEFEHIKIYEEVSERFDDIAAEVRRAL
jgi:hypothetical protein